MGRPFGGFRFGPALNKLTGGVCALPASPTPTPPANDVKLNVFDEGEAVDPPELLLPNANGAADGVFPAMLLNVLLDVCGLVAPNANDEFVDGTAAGGLLLVAVLPNANAPDDDEPLN